MKIRHWNKAWQSCNLIAFTPKHAHIFLPWMIFDSNVQSVLLFTQLIAGISHQVPGQNNTLPLQYLKSRLVPDMQHVAWRWNLSILSQLQFLYCYCCGCYRCTQINNCIKLKRVWSKSVTLKSLWMKRSMLRLVRLVDSHLFFWCLLIFWFVVSCQDWLI